MCCKIKQYVNLFYADKECTASCRFFTMFSTTAFTCFLVMHVAWFVEEISSLALIHQFCALGYLPPDHIQLSC